jgi:2,3-bisphosphoglycerate-dependent phosphoglycerate mutase
MEQFYGIVPNEGGEGENVPRIDLGRDCEYLASVGYYDNMNEPRKKVVYFVRHGQSEGNIDGSFQSLESPLSQEGMMQSERIAERVSKLDFQALIVSPLARTRETAEYITKLTGRQPEYSDLFVERIKPTNLYGKHKSEKDATEIWNEWQETLYTQGMRLEDGENFDDIIARTNKALDFLREHDADRILVVTHGWFLRSIVARVLLGSKITGEAFRNFQYRIAMENAGITVVKHKMDWEGNWDWRLWIYNDHAHLAD